MNVDELSPLIDDLASHIQGVMGIQSMPAITLQEDADNADVLLGKTAYYDPQNKVVTVYVTNRHPKDIMRSIAHEFVHHAQNERGEFDNIGAVGEGYAQSDNHLRNMEKEAYLKGNMCFRDWEDGYKKQMMESIHRQNSFKRRNNTMKIHNWKNNELNRLLMEKFNLGKNTLNEAHCAGNADKDERDEEETIDEAHCMGQGSRGDEPCPDCGKKNCPGKDGKEVNEGSCSGNADKDERKEDEEKVEEKKKFPDLTGDGKVTQADILKGRGVKLDDEEEDEDKKEKQEESFRDSVRKLMEEIIGLE